MVVRTALVAVLLSTAGVAHAGDKPLYQPAPAWVKPAPAPDPRTLNDESPMLLVNDVQAQLGDGGNWTYNERILRLGTVQALSQAGTISIAWQPSHGDLIVHGVSILRNGIRIDALKDKRFTVIRREQGLENMSIDGQLTATLAVEGLRVGDLLDLRFSLTDQDPSFAGNSIANGPLISQPVKIGFARTRLLWPEKASVHWKAYPVGATPVSSDSGGWHELVFAQPLPRQPDAAPDAPGRFARPPLVEASTFADWVAVSKVMAPLFRTEGLIAPGSPLAAEVARIAAADKDPRRRVAAALALVQGKVRYLFNGMDNGNYVPQKPADTWSLRYGDCKAKTLLLLALLHALGIAAEPALANLGAGDLVVERLPSPAAFNHVFVLAKLDGERLWLDGTATGTQFEDLDDVPPFRWVLPLRAEGAQLLAAPNRAPARPEMAMTFNVDIRGGLNIAAPFDVRIVLRGGLVGMWKTYASNADKETLRDALRQFAPQSKDRDTLLTGSDISFDDKSGTATISMRGIEVPHWGYQDRRYSADFNVAAAAALPDRSRAIWKDIPVATGAPGHTQVINLLQLPDDAKGFAIDGKPTLNLKLPGGTVEIAATLQDGLLTVKTEQRTTGAEIAPADLPTARAHLAELRNQRLMVRTAVGYPGPWRGVAAAKRAHRYDVVLQRYADYIAERPDDPERYAARARFLGHIFEYRQALADLDKAISIQAAPAYLMPRSAMHVALGDKAAAIADMEAARDLEPGNVRLLAALTSLMADTGKTDAALALIEPRIEEGGENLPDMLSAKATVLAHAGKGEAALAVLDQAMQDKPDNSGLLNNRCWIAGTLNFALGAALKNCTRAIELGDGSTAAALDSRAMVYFRRNELEKALTDLNAAIEQRPSASSSLFLRAVVEKRLGKTSEAAADAEDARQLHPQVDAEYARWGISL